MNRQRQERDELDDLITDALVEEFAGATPRKDRMTFMAGIRSSAALRQENPRAIDVSDLDNMSKEHQARERHRRRIQSLFETIARFTGPIFDHMR